MMSNKILAWKRTIYTLASMPVVFLAVYQFINLYIRHIYPIGWTEILLVILPCFEIVLIVFLYDQYESHQRIGDSRGWIYILFFLASNLIIVAELGDYYRQYIETSRTVQWAYLNLVPALKILLVSGILFSCFKSRRIIVAFYTEFKLHEENPWKSAKVALVLITIIASALIVRLINLDNFPPYFDEYYHTTQAVRFLEGKPIEYFRAFVTVTFPVVIGFETMGINLLAGRIPMVLLNVIAIYPLFLLGKKVNLSVGLICSALFAFSPFIIATSRNIRDYAVVPLLIYLAANLLLKLLDSVGDMRFPKYLKSNWVQILLALIILAYAIIDDRSVVKIVLSVYGIISILTLIKTIKTEGARFPGFPILFLILSILLLLTWQAGIFKRYLNDNVITYQSAESFWYLLLQSKIHHWYIFPTIGIYILIISSILTLIIFKRQYTVNNFTYLFFFLEFTAVLFYLFYFHLKPNISERIRYGVLLEYWYLPMAATAVWLVYKFLTSFITKDHWVSTAVILIALFINPPAVNSILNYEGGGPMAITGNRHYILAPAYSTLTTQMSEDDIFITDILDNYDDISGQKLRYSMLFNYSEQGILDKVKTYPRGWIALSVIALPENHGLYSNDFEYMGRKIHYLGREGDVNLWKWGE